MNQWLQLFEIIGCFYRELLLRPLWSKYPNHTIDIWESLALFLEGYAFEREGKQKNYPYAAVIGLLCVKRNNGILNQNVAQQIWNCFSQLLNNQGLNPERNPLNPNMNTQQNSSLIDVILNNNLTQQNLTLTTYLENLIKQNNIEQAHQFLKTIRGIGDKIASLFLRDLVDVMGINLMRQIQRRDLLQPVDIWVKQTIKILCKNPKISDAKIRKFIVNGSIRCGLNPERVNMGIWFFGSRIVGNIDKLKAILTNSHNVLRLVNNFRNCNGDTCLHC